MNILIASHSVIPAFKYGGTERVIWSLGRALTQMGHRVTFLVNEGSSCDFAPVIFIDKDRAINTQIPPETDIVHFHFDPREPIDKPYVITMHGNHADGQELDRNTIFISRNHASRFSSDCFVYNGLDWDEYEKPDLSARRERFHFLGNAAWRVKNVRGAIDVVTQTPHERLDVLGGNRLNIKMGLRLTLSPRVSFRGMVGGAQKYGYMKRSRGLIFPVRWHEPFGLAITESLYMGAPVFGTPYGSLLELVGSDFGFLSSRSAELSQAIVDMQFDAGRCHAYARDVFNARVMAQAYLEKYNLRLNGAQLNLVAPRLLELNTPKFLDFN